MTADATLQHDVSDVLIRYATAIDTKDWALLQTCFTAECLLDYGEIGVWRSPEEIAQFMAAAHAGSPHTLHRVTNIVVTATEAGTATARSYIDGLVLIDALTAANPAGYYDDELVRTDEGWQITRRTFTLVLMQIASGVRAVSQATDPSDP